MEKLYYNLSEEEFTKGRKVLLWVFAILFFLAGIYVLLMSLVFNHKSIPAVLASAPLGISLVVTIIAYMATTKRKDLFFSIDDDRIEFRYGVIPEKKSFDWSEISELKMPSKDAKMMILFTNNKPPYIINLNYLKRSKALLIKKQIYFAAREKKLTVHKVQSLV